MDDDLLPGDRAAALAAAAAEAVRGLNHAAREAGGIGRPSAACDILGSLSAAASRLGQALAQVTRYPDQALADGTLGHDLGADPADSVAGTGLFLDDARLSAAALAGDLDAAQHQLALVNARPSLQENQP
jgi:hypothetical protein